MLISSVNDTYELGELNEINVTTPSKSSWHLSNLNSTTKYKFYLRACTSRGCGKPISEDGATLGEGSKCLDLLHSVHSHSHSEVQEPYLCKLQMIDTDLSDPFCTTETNTKFPDLVCKGHMCGFLNN